MRPDINGKQTCQHDPSLPDPKMLMYEKDGVSIVLTLGTYGVITKIEITSLTDNGERELENSAFNIDTFVIKKNKCVSDHVPQFGKLYLLEVKDLYIEIECIRNSYWNILIRDPTVSGTDIAGGFCGSGLIKEIKTDKMSPCNNVLNYILRNYFRIKCNNFEMCKRMWCKDYTYGLIDYRSCTKFVSANQMHNFLQAVCAVAMNRDPITCGRNCKTCMDNLQDFPYSVKETLNFNETLVMCKNSTGILRVQELVDGAWTTKLDAVVNNYEPLIIKTDIINSDYFRLQQCFPGKYNLCEGTFAHRINYK
jgi:hypothetical protein